MILLSLGCGGDRTDAASAEVPKDSAIQAATPEAGGGRDAGPRVLIAGTSLTSGLGLDPSDAYPALLQRKADSAGYGVRIENAGLSGETSAGLLRRLGWLLREPADVVVIETGANDGLRGLEVDSTRENLRRIVREVRAAMPDAPVLLVQMEAPPNLGEQYTTRFRQMYEQVARETGVILVPFLLNEVAGVAELNQEDGIHPNEAGARRVADNVWGALEPALRRVDRTGGNR